MFHIDSYCDGLGAPNTDGVMGGTWSVQAGYSTWGHEAGHLMGLEDQYISYLKEPDLSWVNEANPDEKYSNEEFLNLLHSRNPDKSLTDLQNDINMIDRIGWAKPGHENDLMRTGKTVLKSDIDKLAAQAGLIIDINPGDVLINNDSYQQNLIVTHHEDLFLKPREIKTLNGIYAACIDHYSNIPCASAVFSVV